MIRARLRSNLGDLQDQSKTIFNMFSEETLVNISLPDPGVIGNYFRVRRIFGHPHDVMRGERGERESSHKRESEFLDNT